MFKTLLGIARELLTRPDPDDKYIPPVVTGTYKDYKGNTIIEVTASNYRDVGRITEGTTPAGKTEVHTRVGHNKWEITYEETKAP